MIARMQRVSRLAVLGLLLIAAAPAMSRTWTVEKDGSGDFTVIQDAVDAASSGDVIEIGPGRFDDYQTVLGGNCWFDVHVILPDGMSLAFVGAGNESTIIGPDDPDSHTNNTYGIGGGCDIGLVVRGLKFENCNYFSIGFTTGSLDIEDCHFLFSGSPTADTIGIRGRFTEGRISGCQFDGFYQAVAILSSPGDIEIADCVVENSVGGVYAWSPGLGSVSVRDCEFRCQINGIGFLDGTSGTIERCRLENCGLELTATAEVTVANCEVIRDDGGPALDLNNHDPVTIVDNVFQSNGRVIYLASYGLGTITNNHILRTGNDYWIYCTYHPSFQQDIDLSGNWWGTTDVEEIAAGIWDCQDDDHAYHCVIFEPIADPPVSVEIHSWSEVKSLFRGSGE